MAVKFFNILDYLTFSAMSESEQKAILIESNIYKKGKSTKVDLSLEESEIWRGSSNYPKYLGQDFRIKGIDYKLNEDFLNEVFNECVTCLKFYRIPIIEENIETLKMQIEISDSDFITNQRQKEIKSYQNYLHRGIFKKLHTSDFENEEEHFNILKSYLSVNWFDLSDYLFGLNNIQSYHIVSNYYSYLRQSRILSLLNSKKSLDETVEKDIGKNIFKDDNYFLFEYIVKEYDDIKNKAFFSYLYHYFSDNKYFLKNGKSSTKYNDFLVNNNYITSFSKVIQRVYDEAGDEEKRMFEIFTNHRDSFIQKKLKEN